ncbi:hypothetical protein ACTMTF_16145 [Nonomuraea sp. ZG12]
MIRRLDFGREGFRFLLAVWPDPDGEPALGLFAAAVVGMPFRLLSMLLTI